MLYGKKIVIINDDLPKSERETQFENFIESHDDHNSFVYDIKFDEKPKSYTHSKFKKVKITTRGERNQIQFAPGDKAARGPFSMSQIKSLVAYHKKHILDGRSKSKRRKSKRRSRSKSKKSKSKRRSRSKSKRRRSKRRSRSKSKKSKRSVSKRKISRSKRS